MSHKTAGQFVGVLLHSSTATHFLHLQTASYAALSYKLDRFK